MNESQQTPDRAAPGDNRRLWVIRAGRNGEREELSQQIGAVVPGFSNVPDLTDLSDRQKISAAIKAQNPGYSAAELGSFTGQMHTLRNTIRPGDHILLPLKKDSSRILLGKASGRYFYRAGEADPEERHALPVEWQDAIPRADLGTDLLASVNGARTVFEIKRNNAAERLQAVLNGDRDPGDPDESSGKEVAELYEPVSQDWMPFFAELADALRPYASDRATLLQKVDEVAVVSGRPALFDYLRQWTDRGEKVFAEDIDPFTLLGVMNRGISGEARLAARRGFAEVFQLDTEIPKDFHGIPVLNNMRSRFESRGDSVASGFYDRTWKLFGAALDYSADPAAHRAAFIEAFDEATHSRSPWMYTIGLYWIRPETFLNLDGTNRQFLGSAEVNLPEDISFPNSMTGEQYLRIIEAVQEWLDGSTVEPPSFPALSAVAHRYDRQLRSSEVQEAGSTTSEDSGLEEAPVHSPVPEEPAYSTATIIDEGSFLPLEQLDKMIRRWQEKKNLILQGPPGTGKTWLARKLAKALTGDESTITAVQFHPSTSYEDFIRGWRPSASGRLSLEDGPFLQLIKTAIEQEEDKHVIIIDEINRGDPAQIFGEMLTLLEADKRSSESALTPLYSTDPTETIHLPENLYVIGTMNLADRSLAMVDMALRRRFAFIDLEPQLNEKWRAHCLSHGREAGAVDSIKDRIEQVNTMIREDLHLGDHFLIGHSFVTPTRKRREPSAEHTMRWFEDIVESELLPLLREYWFDAPDRLAEARSVLLD
ncbi:AAA family ATPase [Corynebacterium sp. YIM 101645]|uniref:AAA family ATPase n=1 Tax=Corynebacterium lemuris TaxID=1859292 RepID=A0ABT2FYC6_9CORY|nr:AAA family ATPase [Corynebacterium lemuris]MCS5480233.1 AAA family ATPase [Corynebacterium lemuris]